MRALRFRVQNYRNVDDSGWITLERVTAFVGRNESGKTSILKALHKFNPATEEGFDPQREFPRDRYTREYLGSEAAGGNWPVCSIEFEIPTRLRNRIGRLLDVDHDVPDSVAVTRHYDGSLAFEYTPALDERPLEPEPIVEALRQFASAAHRLKTPDAAGEEAGAGAADPAMWSELDNWATKWTGRLNELDDLRDTEAAALLGDLRGEADALKGPATAAEMGELVAAVEGVLNAVRQPQPLRSVDELIERNLPVLIYFENYGIIDGAIWLPQFLRELERDADDPRARTVSAMFKHVGLDPKELAALGEERRQTASGDSVGSGSERTEEDRRRKEERAIRLSSVSLDVSRQFQASWSQRRHKIRYHADGEYFRIWVADDRSGDVEVELEARSKGFKWFFSFYLVFLAESEEGHKDAILLLDEPGLHLHPSAQRELIALFERLSARNQIAYTTHSPFLIDGEHLDRVRVVAEGDGGHSHVSEKDWPRDRDAVFSLEAAAAYTTMQELFRHGKNLLVERPSDVYYLNLLSHQCAHTGRATLPDDLRVTPCGGGTNLAHIAQLFSARSLRPLVLVDGAEARRLRGDALTGELHARYDADVLMLDEALNRRGQEVEIEDILGEETLLAALEPVLAAPLTLAAENEASGSLPSRIEVEAQRQGVELPDGWRASAALGLASSWAEGGAPLGDDILNTAASLFVRLRTKLARMDRGEEPADDASQAVEDDPDLLDMLIRTVGGIADESPDLDSAAVADRVE